MFFPSLIKPLNFRINNRNHRKLCIIDGSIAYIGGFNVGDEYLGQDPKFGYWRDTHLRITGNAVSHIQGRFILDWHQAGKHERGDYGNSSSIWSSIQGQARSRSLRAAPIRQPSI